MSYTTNRQPQGCPCPFTNLIREAMIGELVAINDYTYHIENSCIKEINDVWEHIAEDEKRHYGMFLKLLRKYDPIQYSKFIEAKEHINLTTSVKLGPISHKINQKNILSFIRDDIKGELEAIILYEDHLFKIPFNDVKQTYFEIIEDEKEHVEELTLVLLNYEKDIYGPIDIEK